jgi:soluble lytic murein transglycosylase-like protein
MRRPAVRRHPQRFGGGRSNGAVTVMAFPGSICPVYVTTCARSILGARIYQERKLRLTICIVVDLLFSRTERDDMCACEDVIRRLWWVVMVGFAFPAFAHEADSGARIAVPPAEDLCLLAEEAATVHGLPLEFFARLIWRESRFKPDAVGPATRSGQHAQGIAQFMPDTAKARGVFDPFDPSAALPKSAEFLRELRTQFGNLGLAAAAYNAGPTRVRNWLAGRSSLPGQTRSYVSAITGRSADAWAADARRGDGQQPASDKPASDKPASDKPASDKPARDKPAEERLAGRKPAPAKRLSCSELIALLKAQQVLHANAPGQRVCEGDAFL